MNLTLKEGFPSTLTAHFIFIFKYVTRICSVHIFMNPQQTVQPCYGKILSTNLTVTSTNKNDKDKVTNFHSVMEK